MFRHILVPMDSRQPSHQALRHATQLAHSFNAQITLLKVVKTGDLSNSSFVDPLQWHITKTEAEIELGRSTREFEAVGLHVETNLIDSLDALRVLDFARNHAVDLIILTNEGENISDFVHQISAETSIPVLILPAQETGAETAIHYKTLLAPLDGSQRAECVLPYMTSLMQANQSKLILAHVVRKPEMPSRSPLPREEAELMDRITERKKQEATTYLEQLRSRFPAGTETHITTSDNVSTALRELIEQESVDLVLLSAHGHSGEPSWPYGSETTKLMAYSKTPILLVQDMRVPVPTSLAGDSPVREARGR